jgi:uncharacterized protein (TIGR03086 family)
MCAETPSAAALKATRQDQPVRDDLLATLDAANDEFRRRLVSIAAGLMSRATPCPEWSVGDLIAHVVESNLWVAQLLETADFDAISASIDVLGSDPVAAWEVSVDRLDRGFGRGLGRQVRHPYGVVPAGRLLFFRCSDTLVHAWDLARAVGVDESLNMSAVRVCLDVLEPVALLLCGTGMYEPPVPVEADADEQTQLLALVGRRP